MKITRIQAENFVGARSVDVKICAPVTLFAGKNGAGKSSVHEAVRMALCGETVRVDLKKDFGCLLSVGAGSGFVAVEWDGGEASCVLPKGDRHIAGDGQISGALPFVLDAQRFSRLPDAERRAFLFGLTGLRCDGQTVADMLAKRGCNASMVARIQPLLRAGFESAEKWASGNARDAKARWKQITGGETYGAIKAETWQAEKPDFDAAALAQMNLDIARLQNDIDAHTQHLGDLTGRRDLADGAAVRLEALREKAGKFARIQDRLLKDECELKAWTEKVEETKAKAQGERVKPSFACPCCGAVLAMEAGGRAVEYVEPESKPDPDAVANLPEYQRAMGLMANAVANGKRDLLAAESAAQQLKEAEDAPEIVTAEAVSSAKAKVDELKKALAAILAARRDLESAHRAAGEAEAKTVAASATHAEVSDWCAISDALSPSGIPADLLRKALGPINVALAESSAFAEWPQVVIDGEMRITAGGTEYRMLSESEKWRADALIAGAVSSLSGVKLLVLDRFDVLDSRGREDCVYWLDALAGEGRIESALLFGTLKTLPSGLPQTFGVIWIENGVAGCVKAAA